MKKIKWSLRFYSKLLLIGITLYSTIVEVKMTLMPAGVLYTGIIGLMLHVLTSERVQTQGARKSMAGGILCCICREMLNTKYIYILGEN